MKKIHFLTLFTLSFFHLEADLQSYFKPAPDKSEIPTQQVKNVDFIYVINLDQRPEKWAHSVQELLPYGIHPYRFSAVNGWELSLEAVNDLGVKYEPSFTKTLWGTAYLPDGNFLPHHEVMQVVGRNYFCHCMSRGAIGIILSHLSVLQDAYDSGYETIWVMEDDIEVIQNPHLMSELIERLDEQVGKQKWDLLFTDQDTKDQQGQYVECRGFALRPNFTPPNPNRLYVRKKISKDFRKIGLRYGSYSVIVRRSGMKKILDFFKQYHLFLPYDMEFYFPPKINLYTVLDDVVSTQPRASSDNGSPNYQ